jgi:hypothetical protein
MRARNPLPNAIDMRRKILHAVQRVHADGRPSRYSKPRIADTLQMVSGGRVRTTDTSPRIVQLRWQIKATRL